MLKVELDGTLTINNKEQTGLLLHQFPGMRRTIVVEHNNHQSI